jgi:23S rRNA (guanosine2251-2'-O)-methyltransferase
MSHSRKASVPSWPSLLRSCSEMKSNWDQLEGRNVVIEALSRNRRKVHRIFLDERAKSSHKIQELHRLADQAGVDIKKIPRQKLDRMSQTEVHNGVIAHADSLPVWTTKALLSHLFDKGEDPFLILVDEVQYEHNLGAILRSAMGAGAHAVIVPVKRGKGLSSVVQRVAMGGAEEVPLIREGLSSALAQIRKAGIPVVGADMGGEPVWQVRLQRACAIVLGGESKGLSPTLRRRCDVIAAIPLQKDLESLNVSVTAAVMMFEKCRQDLVGK